jgi:hypothetical protein
MPDDAQVDPRRIIEELRRELDARTAERDEALAERAAMAEIVQITNSSPGNLAPVFDAMLERAMRLCEADFGIMLTLDGGGPRIVAERSVPEALTGFLAQHSPDIAPDTFFCPRGAWTLRPSHPRYEARGGVPQWSALDLDCS